MTDYLTLVEVLAIHADQIQRYGGAEGIRDPGRLMLNAYFYGKSAWQSGAGTMLLWSREEIVAVLVAWFRRNI